MTTKESRLAHIQTWEKSGLTKQEYCVKNGLKYATFISWFKKEKVQTAGGKFIVLPAVSSQDVLTIQFPNGIKISYTGSLDSDLINWLFHA